MNKTVKIIISWLCVLFAMALIFSFSAENKEKSAKTSGSAVEKLLGIVMEKDEITNQMIEKYQSVIRKSAHFIIFAFLGFCSTNAFLQTISKSKYYSILSIPLSFLYAISDEYHQNFSDGRAPSWKDVLIDTSGAIAGAIIFILLITVFYRISKKVRH